MRAACIEFLERGLECGVRQLVDSYSTHQRVSPDTRHDAPRSSDDAGLWAAEKLVATEHDGVGAGGDAGGYDGFVR